MSFRCVVVTPEQQVLDETVQQAIIPAHDGLFGILTGRAPLLVKLGLGPMRLDLPGGGSKSFLVEGGVAQMKGNALTLLTQHAIPGEEITADSAKPDLAEAESNKGIDDASFNRKQTAMQRARVKQQMAKR